MKRALLLALLVTPAAAEPDILRERFEYLGQFAGYVVACGVASEDEASEMVRTLGAGLGDSWPEADAARLRAARDAARTAPCPDGPQRDAIRRRWANYLDARAGLNRAP